MSAWFARILVFFTSAAVLVLEILAGRMLAPYVGVTLQTFTGIIGTVLAGISLGSWLGGRAADRGDPARMLGPLLVGGGILAILTYPIVTTIGPAASGQPVDIVILAAVGFFAPAAVLSAVTPTVTKLRLGSLSETGAVVGRLSALATAGAIFGTFATGFVLVASWPSRTIALVVGGALVVAGLAISLTHGRATKALALTLAFGALAAAGGAAAVNGPCQFETAYFCARVEPDGPNGRILWLDTLRHSYVDLADPTHLEFRYAKIFGAVLDTQPPPGPLRVLSIGGGGFTFPRYLEAVRPGTTNVVLELDPELVTIAVRELGLDPTTMDIRTGDARLTVDDLTGTFDVVIGDAFGGLAVPWHLTTVEFLEEIESRLNPGGIYLLNLIDRPPLGFARAEAATLDAVFATVLVIAPAALLNGTAGGNFVLVASNRELEPGALRRELATATNGAVIAGGDDLTRFIGSARPLTDAYAPVDQLLTP